MGLEKLYFIIQKNLRQVFRNWMTFLLLVLGPMILILVVGFAFSGDDLHDIAIGVHAPKDAEIQDIVDALASEEISIVYFPRIDNCIRAMNHSVINICADFSEDFGEGEGSITFYYDATRYNLVRYILEYLKEQVAITSEQVSLETAEQIFSDIDSFVADMQTGQEQVHDLRDSALLLQQDLIRAHEEVEAAQNAFDPSYFRIKRLQVQLNATILNYSEKYAETANMTEVIDDLTILEDSISSLNTSLHSIEAALIAGGIPYNKTTFTKAYANLEDAAGELESTIASLHTTEDLENLTLEQAMDLLDQINEIVGYLDDVHNNLAETELLLRSHIENIDTGVTNLDGLSASFDTYIETFSGINQSDAEKFLHPLTATFEQIPKDAEENKTAIVFPIILVFMMSFICILLSNMLVLNETHSPAYFRSFLVPAPALFFILGIFITNLLLVGFQLLIFFIVAYLSFGVSFFLNLPVFLSAVFIGTVFYILVGMLFGYVVQDRQTSLLFSLFFSLIMFFFSDVIFPLEIMPPAAAAIAQFSPLVLLEALFRQTLFFGHGIADQWFGFSAIGLYSAVLACFVIAAYYWNRRMK